MAPSRASATHNLKKKKKSHGWAVLIFILGTLFPPLAVAARFGIGKDFWINLPLTIAGYIPGHVHNFYIQNIRNNKTHARTPKWAIRYGLVDDSKLRRNARRSEWANRYNDRDPNNDYDEQPVEEGQVPDAPRPPPKSSGQRGPNGEAPLWDEGDEHFYNAESSRNRRGGANASTPSVDSGSRSSGRWHYPANFDDAVVPANYSSGSSKKSKKKDRWARAEEARLGTGVDDGGRRKKKSRRSTVDSRSSSYNEGPESAVGGSYGGGSRGGAVDAGGTDDTEEGLNHQF